MQDLEQLALEEHAEQLPPLMAVAPGGTPPVSAGNSPALGPVPAPSDGGPAAAAAPLPPTKASVPNDLSEDAAAHASHVTQTADSESCEQAVQNNEEH